MNYLNLAKKAEEQLKRNELNKTNEQNATVLEAIQVRKDGGIRAVKVSYGFLDDEIWLVFDPAFVPCDGLASYYAEEVPLLRNRTQEELREIHQYKLAYPGVRLLQDGNFG